MSSLADDAVPTVHVDVVHQQTQGARVDRQRGRLKEKDGNNILDLRRLGDSATPPLHFKTNLYSPFCLMDHRIMVQSV